MEIIENIREYNVHIQRSLIEHQGASDCVTHKKLHII